ncbi:MarR family winged helix-turn-helix transcriptional regulator [Rariglobus hedericola]|uniref:MarR family transcriptional regulator n=1 Tax=Rariglobus hedericola TaxID=2597822 RepID=A0A556QQ90_9BACT|nr:MarR family transcriptional regulator [Rariglobus hedericola]TSJ78782.1 MarR family transcriptional regulator [Rariglobus hedericola]
MQPELGHELTRAVMTTADVFLRESQRLFRPHGITAAQYNVFSALASAGEGISQRELGDVLVVDRSNVTGLVDRMEKAGWVKREDDPADRRVYRVILTPAGRRLWEKVSPAYQAVVMQVVGALTQKQARETLQSLKELQAGAVAWRLPEE